MEITPEEFEELKDSFQYNDLDKDGRIVLDEFINMLDELEAEVGAEEARVGFDAIDTDNDGVIDLGEFVQWWRGR